MVSSGAPTQPAVPPGPVQILGDTEGGHEGQYVLTPIGHLCLEANSGTASGQAARLLCMSQEGSGLSEPSKDLLGS